MSKKTWLAEFMPTSADTPKTAKGAVKHSLRKWRGLEWKNLMKHGLTPETAPQPGSENCALCVMFMNKEGNFGCGKCPLANVRCGISCDSKREYEAIDPYGAFTEYGDARPMVRELERALGVAS